MLFLVVLSFHSIFSFIHYWVKYLDDCPKVHFVAAGIIYLLLAHIPFGILMRIEVQNVS